MTDARTPKSVTSGGPEQSVALMWDEPHNARITAEQAHEVAANWNDTTQLSNALDAAAFEIERLSTALERIDELARQGGHDGYVRLNSLLSSIRAHADRARRGN